MKNRFTPVAAALALAWILLSFLPGASVLGWLVLIVVMGGVDTLHLSFRMARIICIALPCISLFQFAGFDSGRALGLLLLQTGIMLVMIYWMVGGLIQLGRQERNPNAIPLKPVWFCIVAVELLYAGVRALLLSPDYQYMAQDLLPVRWVLSFVRLVPMGILIYNILRVGSKAEPLSLQKPLAGNRRRRTIPQIILAVVSGGFFLFLGIAGLAADLLALVISPTCLGVAAGVAFGAAWGWEGGALRAFFSSMGINYLIQMLFFSAVVGFDFFYSFDFISKQAFVAAAITMLLYLVYSLLSGKLEEDAPVDPHLQTPSDQDS